MGLGRDIEELETEIFGGNPGGISRRIYELSRQVLEFQRAAKPLCGALESLIEGDDEHEIDPEVKSYLRHIQGHVLQVMEQFDGFHDLLSNILIVNLTLVSVGQADQSKKISAWAAILIIPTIITVVYRMNFEHLPELTWVFGYPLALALIVIICGSLYAVFKRAGWM